MGLLDYIDDAKSGLLSQYAQGAPYREALGGLLQGNTQPIQQLLTKKSYMSPDDAVNIGLGFAPMGIAGTIGNVKTLAQLVKENPSTYPKIPANKVFMNDVGSLETPIRFKADDAFANKQVNNQSVNINDIIPTQRNVTAGNIRSVEGIDELPELILSNGKYYISDGHHRIARDILAGKSQVNAKVYKND